MSVVEEHMSVADFREQFDRIQSEVAKVMVGQENWLTGNKWKK